MNRQTAVMRIAREEWRYWLRSRTGTAACVAALVLVAASLVSTAQRTGNEALVRAGLQAQAEETFRSQPARHPHRMVHYGHYVFRTPAPLAVVDPGVDALTGTIAYLEGHKQNSATFAPRFTDAHGGPYASLSPALAYQLFVPLLLIVVGFASLARERERSTDRLLLTMNVSPATLWLGKSLALALLAALALVPLIVPAVQAWLVGESASVVLAFWLGYAVYLAGWVFLITAASVWSRRAVSALLVLLSGWMVVGIVVPRAASSAADAWVPMIGKVESDLEIGRELRDVGDGHNAGDPAFAKLRAELLAQYGVQSVEALPLNFRGIVAEVAETRLTDVLKRHAEHRMRQEQAQSAVANTFSVLSPYLAMKSFSTITAGTGLSEHHRFLRDAEALRFSFVQELNRLHARELAYTDDINRSRDHLAEQRTRVDAHHWRLLDEFRWSPSGAQERLAAGMPYLGILLLWLAAAVTIGWAGARRMRGFDG